MKMNPYHRIISVNSSSTSTSTTSTTSASSSSSSTTRQPPLLSPSPSQQYRDRDCSNNNNNDRVRNDVDHMNENDARRPSEVLNLLCNNTAITMRIPTEVDTTTTTTTAQSLQQQQQQQPQPLLLQELHRSFHNNNNNDDDNNNNQMMIITTLAQCLRRRRRRRSKHTQSVSMEVTRLLKSQQQQQSQTTRIDMIDQSDQYIRSFLIPFIIMQHQTLPKPSPLEPTTTTTTVTATTSIHTSTATTTEMTTTKNSGPMMVINCLEHIATIGRFLEYLFEYSSNHHIHHHSPTTTTTTITDRSSSHNMDQTDIVEQSYIRPMILQLLQSLTDMSMTIYNNHQSSCHCCGSGSAVTSVPSSSTSPSSSSSMVIDVEYCYHRMNLYSLTVLENSSSSNNDDAVSTTTTTTTAIGGCSMIHCNCHCHTPASTTSAVVTIIYIFGTLLRTNEYCRNGHPYILSTLYKSLCRIVSISSPPHFDAAVVTTKQSTTTTISECNPSTISSLFSIIPLALRQQTIAMILEHIHDGMDTMISIMIPTPPAMVVPDVSPMVLKIVTFLVSRLYTFVAISTPPTTTTTTTTTTLPMGDENETPCTNDVAVHTLLQLRGIMALLEAATTTATLLTVSIPHQENTATTSAALLRCNKIDQCLFVINDGNMYSINNINYASSRQTQDDNGSNRTIITQIMSEMIFFIGKLHVSTNLLATMLEHNNTDENDTSDDRISDIDLIVETVEELLLHTIPTTVVLIQRYYQKLHYSHYKQETALINHLVPSRTLIPIIAATLIQIEESIVIDSERDDVGSSNGGVSRRRRWTLDRFFHSLIHWLSRQIVVYSDDTPNKDSYTMSSPSLEWMIQILARYINACHSKTNCGRFGRTENDTTVVEKHPLLLLVIQLLWDDRTDTKLRYGLSRVIICLMTNESQQPASVDVDNDNDIDHIHHSSLNTSMTTNIVGSAVLSQVKTYLTSPTLTKKRKLCTSDLDDERVGDSANAPDKQRPNPTSIQQRRLSSMSTIDWQIILSVISNIPLTCTNAFEKLVPDYVQSFEHYLSTNHFALPSTIPTKDLHMMSIFTSLLHLLQRPSNVLYESILTCADAFFLSIPQGVSGQGHQESNGNSNECSIQYDQLWMLTILRRIRWYCRSKKRNKDEDNYNVELHVSSNGITRTFNLLHAVVRRTYVNAGTGKDEMYVPVFVEAVQALGEIGWVLDERMIEIVLAEEQQRILNSLAACFYAVLSSPYWTIRLHGITSLVQFAKIIHFQYKSILPKCVPPAMQKILQGRLQQKSVSTDAAIAVTDNVQLLQSQSIDMLYEAIQKQHSYISRHECQYCVTNEHEPTNDKTVDESTTTPTAVSEYLLPIGSYCMTMPTQEGRSAVVIFPPNAMEDLRTMVQQQQPNTDDEDEMEGPLTLEWMNEHNIQQLQKETMLIL